MTKGADRATSLGRFNGLPYAFGRRGGSKGRRKFRVSDLQAEIMARFRALIEARDMSDAQFAAALREAAPWTKASKNKVMHWFAGRQELGVRELKAIAKLFKVALADLILGEPEDGPRPPDEDEDEDPPPPELRFMQDFGKKYGYRVTLHKIRPKKSKP